MNPCVDHICGWGKECIVDKQGEPICECISKCPSLDNDPFDQVAFKSMLKLKEFRILPIVIHLSVK